MSEVVLSATPRGNGYQATVTFPASVSISSAETYPTIAEAITAAAQKLLSMPDRIIELEPKPARLDHGEREMGSSFRAALGARDLPR